MKILFFLATLLSTSHSYTWSHKAPIVFANECDHLKTQLADASQGGKFVLMTNLATDAHTAKEPVEIRDNLRFILQMSLMVRFHTGKPVVQVDSTLTQYLSDENKLRHSGHDDVVQSLNLVRGFVQGGIGDLCHYEDWVVVENKESKKTMSRIGDCVRFLDAFPIRPSSFHLDNYYTGHAAQVASYEREMTRNDSVTNRTYACSSHFLWIEELPDPLMVRHLSGVQNPLGIVATDDTRPELVADAIKKLNPENEKGKITIIVRMRRSINTLLPALVEAVQSRGSEVLWCCDPWCHSNLRNFMRVHERKNSVAGGVFIRKRDIATIQFLLKNTRVPPPRLHSQWNRFSM